ncbi:dehydrogenase/reductase SDR family member 8 [Xylariaceae sp. FL0804]|nr:dehydrogenase/reductase SDR family member 8 [Xylariaceae sp. FL0804]
MPMHSGFLPREGFTADPIFKLIGKTALNPVLLLPLMLLARFTKKGEDMTMLHPTAYSRLKTLFYIGLARWLSAKYSDGVINNWKRDRYDWPREIAVVTGGAGGIGGHLVKLLAESGLTVVVLDIQPLTFDAGPKVHYFKCDLTSAADVARVAGEVRAAVGDPTILVNNAGVARGKTVLETTERDLRFTFDVNAFAHYHTVRQFLPSMVARDHGMVVTVASYAAWLVVPNMVDYGMSKAAALAFHEGLTAELATRYNAPRVRTVIVNQGYTKTALFTGYNNTAGFLVPSLEPESVADAIARQILTGRSGQVVAPAFGRVLQLARGLPHWYAYGLRAKGENIMTSFSGRQVVADLAKHYAAREKRAGEEEETEKEKEEEKKKKGEEADSEGSTVLVPETKA